MYAFSYHRAQSLADAADALRNTQDAMPLAGGMSLVPVMRHRLASPAVLVDLNAIAELRGITVTGSSVRVGAMTTHYAVSCSSELQRAIPALARLAGGIGDPLVRNRGTIGGSLAHNDPAACYPCALLGLNATVHTDRRTIAADNFIRGTFQTALEAGEIITAVEFPRPDIAAHIKFENFASRFSIVGVFVARAGGRVRVGITGAGPYAFRATQLEAALERDFSPAAIADLHVPPSVLIGDVHASAEFRSHLITELAGRAVAQCRPRGGAIATG
jgi:carbon-monoxide dehydrogenase medium subunit